MSAIKFFIHRPDIDVPLAYRLQMSLFKSMDWNKLMKKLHEITHFQFAGFTLTWNDGFHNCILTDIKDIMRAVEYIQDKELVDDCLHVKVNTIPKSLPNQSVCGNLHQSNKPIYYPYPPTYAEAIGSQAPLTSKGKSKVATKVIIIRPNQQNDNQEASIH
ncbi:unnamed protein product [Trichobilharzia szidati]|nr:unnamed protein product [Trichobilharzia szidati]